MKHRKATLLLEILVSMIVIGLLGSMIASYAMYVLKTSELQEYRFTAINLAREVLEFGEGIEYHYTHTWTTCWPFRTPCTGTGNWNTPCGACCCSCIKAKKLDYTMTYDYKPNLDAYSFIYISDTSPTDDFVWHYVWNNPSCPWSGAGQVDQPYEESFDIATLNPFTSVTGVIDRIGDIKAKGMVPQPNEDSVVITYDVTTTATIPNDDYKEGFAKHVVKVEWQNINNETEDIVFGMVPLNRVNDTYKLSLSRFWWE